MSDDDDFVSGDDDDQVGDDDDQVGDDDDNGNPDSDGDGWTTAQGDCNDNNPNVNPGADEIPCNGVDDDCTGGDNDEGLFNTFSTGGQVTEVVDIVFDEESRLLKTVFNWDLGGNTSAAYHITYRTFDESLARLDEIDTVPSGDMLTSGMMKIGLDDEGVPYVFAYRYSSEIIWLYPTNYAETNWDYDVLVDQSGYYVSGIDLCAPGGFGGNSPVLGWAVNGEVHFGVPVGGGYEYYYFSDESSSSLAMGCRSSDELALMYNNSDGLVSRVFDVSSETLSTTELLSSTSSAITGAGSRYGGEPYVLYHHQNTGQGGATVERSWSDNDNWSTGHGLSDLPFDGYSRFGGAAFSENDLGHMIYTYSNDAFCYVEDDFRSAQYTYWWDDSQPFTFSDVTVDRDDRVWIVYGNDDEYNVWMRCSE